MFFCCMAQRMEVLRVATGISWVHLALGVTYEVYQYSCGVEYV